MSRGWGARTERQSRVLLNVYDLHDTNEYLEVSDHIYAKRYDTR